MEKIAVLAVLDLQVGAYQRPMFAPSIGAGVRAFADEVNREGSEMNKHPADYVLCELASWNEESGRFSVLPEPRQVALGGNVVVKKGE